MKSAVLGWALSASAAGNFNSVYISEFLAENRRSLQDNDGDHSGWIELYNGGSDPVSLKGWFLSDTATNVAKWRFPPMHILPGAYLVIFASGKDRTNDWAHLHTNFRMAPEGGYLSLAGAATNLLSVFRSYPHQSPDVSYGRVPGEPNIHGPFRRPTPGKPNQSSGPGFAPQVTFSREGASFTTPFPVALACVSTSAIIRYTLDGRLPNQFSPVYRSPILVTNTLCLRARAYEDGLLPGPPHSGAYVLLATNVLAFKTPLPVLVVNPFGFDASAVVHLSFHEPGSGKTSLTNQPGLTARGSFHVRGSSSQAMPQPSFAMEFLDEFDHEQPLSPLGLPANSDWVLYAPNAFDPGMIHNPFIHQLSREMGRYSPRTRFLEVYVVQHPGPLTAGDYLGIYVLEEKIKIGKHRLDIDRLGANDLKPPEVTGGYLLKFDRVGPGERGFRAGGVSMVYVDPKEPVIELPQRAPQRKYISEYFDEFDRVLHGPDWKDPVKGYRAYVDVDSWIDFHVLEVLSGNVDIFRYSTFFFKPRGGKIAFGPHWDFDRALGSIDRRDSYPRRWNTGRFFDAPWWSRLFSDPDFWQLWVDRWQTLRRTTFSEPHLFDLADRLADQLREAQPREVKRWGLEPRGGSYQSEIDLMKVWLSERIDFIDSQLVQPPRLNHPGGQVAPGYKLTFTGPPEATIHYTLDGSDPRLAGGGISSNALTYADPIVLQRNIRVMVRALNPSQRQTGGPPTSTPWSSPVTAEFAVERP